VLETDAATFEYKQNTCYAAGCTANTGYFMGDRYGYSNIESVSGEPYNGDWYFGYIYS
jgi:hypothetical protein